MKKNTIKILLLILVAFLLAGCAGSDQLTGTSWPGILATDEFVYVAYNSHVYALNPAAGTEKWRFPEEAQRNVTFFSTPVLVNDNATLVAAGYDNIIYSIDPNSGAPGSWIFDQASNRYIADLVAGPDQIYASSADGNLYAIDFNGAASWTAPFATENPQWSGPVFDGQTLFLGGLDQRVHAIDPENGSELWSEEIGEVISSSPAIENGTLVVGTFGGQVITIDTATGNTKRVLETENWVWGSPAVSDGIIFAGDISGNLYAFDLESGDELWVFPADGPIYGGPMIASDGSIIFGTETGNVYSLSPEMDVNWTETLMGKVYNSPVQSGDLVLVSILEGETLINALVLENGDTRWSFMPEN